MNRNIGRLALRVEDNWWVAYYAVPNTMEGAVELGRIQMEIVQDELRKKMFMDVFISRISDLIKEQTGSAPESWATMPAPDHEKKT